MSRRGEAAQPKEEEMQPRAEGKEFMTKAEYNRWLVRQQNAKMAEETRQMAKEGEDIIKERQRTHTAQGLSRQQAAMVQMKRASESLEAHRQQNLTHGRKVYEEVAGWRNGARQIKDDYATHGRNVMAQTKADNKTGAAIAEHMEHKKKQAADTRADDDHGRARTVSIITIDEEHVHGAGAAAPRGGGPFHRRARGQGSRRRIVPRSPPRARRGRQGEVGQVERQARDRPALQTSRHASTAPERLRKVHQASRG